MTEFGYFDSIGNSNVVTGLFAADVYATALEEGADSVHFLEMSAAPFLSDNSALTRGPAFRAMQMLDQFFDSGDELIAAASGSANVKVHAVRQSDGTVAVMIINLLSGAGNSANVSIGIEGSPLGNRGIQWAYGSTGGAAPVQSNVSGLGNSFDYNIAPRTLILLLIPPAGLPGDYNDDGSVDAADYVVWRNTLNQNVPVGSGADGDGNGIIQEADYVFWQANFGHSATGSSAEASTAIPEPTAASLGTIASAILMTLHRRRRQPSFAYRGRNFAIAIMHAISNNQLEPASGTALVDRRLSRGVIV
jgi:hypothetical protein